MAWDPIATGDQVAAFVKTVGITAGTPVTDAQLRALWEGIFTILHTNLENAEVASGSFQANGNPVTGVGGGIT